jgi:peptide chain release factor 3
LESPVNTTQSTADAQALAAAIRRRRTFAIISHPDAGKTTLTEKLLLYGGAIHLAGAVKARRAQRHAASDWMELEQERGISVTSSVMQFEYDGYQINLLDTPGHEDFSEDTYRTLVAADSAVMLLDNRRGVEERTRQLFEVCKRRRTPIFTFVNKCDRAGEDPLKLISDVEADLGIACCPVTWPIFRDGAFVGVYDRRMKEIHLFERDETHGAREAITRVGSLESPELKALLGDAAHEQLAHDVMLLDEAGHPFSEEEVLAERLTPVFFGSALTNFGVEPFLREFLELAPAPTARESTIGPVVPTDPAFTGFVFKIQANMDPKHRDRIAFVRVCSGKFEAGMQVRHVRTGKMIRLASPQQFMARERSAVEEAWPGDVIGVMDRGNLRIGDSLSTDGDLEFADIPRFAPEHFARVVPKDPMRRKQFDTGLRELTEEGAAQVFYSESEAGPIPIVGAVGMLQFDVMQYRLEHEYGAPVKFERIPFRHPRWVTGPESEIDRVATQRGRMRLYDAKGNPLILFEDEWNVRWAQQNETKVEWHKVAP